MGNQLKGGFKINYTFLRIVKHLQQTVQDIKYIENDALIII